MWYFSYKLSRSLEISISMWFAWENYMNGKIFTRSIYYFSCTTDFWWDSWGKTREKWLKKRGLQGENWKNSFILHTKCISLQLILSIWPSCRANRVTSFLFGNFLHHLLSLHFTFLLLSHFIPVMNYYDSLVNPLHQTLGPREPPKSVQKCVNRGRTLGGIQLHWESHYTWRNIFDNRGST